MQGFCKNNLFAFNLLPGSPLRTALKSGYSFQAFQADLLAGISVGIIALPLAMALAIASGVPPQQGLYTSIFAGIVIALTGGARFNVSGPTAAFVVVLLPISQQFGLAGLLTATLFGGAILVLMGLARLGGVIRLIPYPVVIGFTTGVGIVIAGLQLKDFFGLSNLEKGGFLTTLAQVAGSMEQISWADTSVGLLTLAVLLLFPKSGIKIPAHLVAVVTGTLLAYLLHSDLLGMTVHTIGNEFHYQIGDQVGNGVPAVLPTLALPWNWSGNGEKPLVWSLTLFKELGTAGFTIAILGAIESLLCAVVADGMTGTQHNPNKELIGQGLGNLVAPFFGGIPATAAIARTTANIRSGAFSPLSAAIHGIFLLLVLVFFSSLLGYIPMASLAALLLVVAWNMAEVRHFIRIVKIAPRSDVVVLLSCTGLTVFVDMIAAVTVGVSLASMLFIRRMSELTSSKNLQEKGACLLPIEKSEGVIIYAINGPLFFGAAQKAIHALEEVDTHFHTLVLDLTHVEMIDMTGIVALESLLANLKRIHAKVVICGPSTQVSARLTAAGILHDRQNLFICENLDAGIQITQAEMKTNP